MEEGGIPAARIVQEQEQPSPDMFRRLCVQFLSLWQLSGDSSFTMESRDLQSLAENRC
jgi:hypothetical protein